MLSLGSEHRYFLYRKPCDMRKSFDGLSGIERGELKKDPTNGDVFVFINKSRRLLKLLHWEAGGLVLYYKRLERGTFTPPICDENGYLKWLDLILMIEGIQVEKSKKKVRFSI